MHLKVARSRARLFRAAVASQCGAHDRLLATLEMSRGQLCYRVTVENISRDPIAIFDNISKRSTYPNRALHLFSFSNRNRDDVRRAQHQRQWYYDGSSIYTRRKAELTLIQPGERFVGVFDLAEELVRSRVINSPQEATSFVKGKKVTIRVPVYFDDPALTQYFDVQAELDF